MFIITVQALALNSQLTVYAAGNDDNNHKEIGVEWVNDYSEPGWDNLQWSDDNAEGFYNVLVNKGFTGKFHYGNRLAWESDFEKASVGGNDDYYVDNVDFVYFSGHGNSSSFLFGRNKDGEYPGGDYHYQVHYTEADWGDKDLEWIFISACEVLEQYPTEWNPAFHSPKTLHGMTGFHTSLADTDDVGELGEVFAKFLTGDYGPAGSIYESWYSATTQVGLTGDGEVWAAIYAVKVWYHPPPPQPEFERYYWNEYLPSYGDGMYSDPPSPQPGLTITIKYDKWKVYPWW